MKRAANHIVAILVLGAIGACSSEPVHYHTLLSPQEVPLPSTGTEQQTVVVYVERLPAALGHRELMIRTGPADLALLENDLWASPLRDEVRDSLRSDLQRALSDNSPSQIVPSEVLTVRVEVQRFEGSPGRYASVILSWNASYSSGSRDLRRAEVKGCTFSASDAIGENYSDMVRAYQRDLQLLSDVIVSSIRLTNAESDPCPRV